MPDLPFRIKDGLGTIKDCFIYVNKFITRITRWSNKLGYLPKKYMSKKNEIILMQVDFSSEYDLKGNLYSLIV